MAARPRFERFAAIARRQTSYCGGGNGEVSTGTGEGTAVEQQQEEESSFSRSLDFLIELYFPHNIVGSGTFARDRWGVDVVWEP